MTKSNIAPSPLVFNGEIIRDKPDTLCLTDMWKAAGSPENKRPANWARKEGAEFIAHVSEIHNVPMGHIMKAERGKNGSTWAHWQIGLAYAKYLSAEFHMWCNEVVRERMEGKSVAQALSLDENAKRTLGGIVKSVVHAQLVDIMPALIAGHLAEHSFSYTDGVTAGEACDLAKVATAYPRGLSGKVSRRLAQFCARNGEKPRVSRLGRVRAQLFPTHLVREWLDVEGRHLIRQWIAERQGQGKLHLVGGLPS